MKKYLLCIIVLGLCLFSTYIEVKGLDSREYYVVKTDDSEMLEYVSEHISKFVFATIKDAKIKEISYSTGITVVNSKFTKEIIYPVYYDKTLVGCMVLYNLEGELSSCYTTEYNDAINMLLNQTTKNTPAYLIVIDDSLCCVKGDIARNISTNEIVETDLSQIEIGTTTLLTISYLDDTYEPDVYQVKHNWTRYAYQNDSNALQCVPYSLYNILRNKGYIYQGYSNFLANIKSFSIDDCGMRMDYYGIESYLSYKGYSTYFQSRTDKLSWANIKTVVNVRSNYVMMINAISGETDCHATVLTGYIIYTNGTYDFYVYEPFNPNELIIDGDAANIIFSSAGKTYTWNSGYYAGIH